MKNQHQESKTPDWKSTLFGLGGLFGVLLLLYATGWHAEVKFKLQQGLLWTGLIQADTNLSEKEKIRINYDMPLITLAGEYNNLSDFKGKVIFINFWASWCGPCRVEMPGIQALYEQYQDEPELQFIMVTLDEEPEKARQFLEDGGYTFGSHRLIGERPEELQSEVIPATFVINKDGVIVAKKAGIANYNTAAFRTFLDSLLED